MSNEEVKIKKYLTYADIAKFMTVVSSVIGVMFFLGSIKTDIALIKQKIQNIEEQGFGYLSDKVSKLESDCNKKFSEILEDHKKHADKISKIQLDIANLESDVYTD